MESSRKPVLRTGFIEAVSSVEKKIVSSSYFQLLIIAMIVGLMFATSVALNRQKTLDRQNLAAEPGYADYWTAEYFNDKIPDNKPALIRSDPVIDFIWPGSPGANIHADGFSVRWTKTQYYAGGLYTVSVKHNDGMRIWIDDQLVYNSWFDQAASDRKFTSILSTGDHTVRVEMYNAVQDAVASVSFSPSI